MKAFGFMALAWGTSLLTYCWVENGDQTLAALAGGALVGLGGNMVGDS